MTASERIREARPTWRVYWEAPHMGDVERFDTYDEAQARYQHMLTMGDDLYVALIDPDARTLRQRVPRRYL